MVNRGQNRAVNLKNYTSDVPIERTISRIEQVLAKAGASGVSKEFNGGGVPVSMTFRIEMGHGEVNIRLPANSEQVFEAMKKEVQRPRRGTYEKLKEQAGRTSWKLMQDWVEVQCSLIAMQQADVMQVFLPYVWDGKQTFYHALKDRQFKGLLTEKSA